MVIENVPASVNRDVDVRPAANGGASDAAHRRSSVPTLHISSDGKGNRGVERTNSSAISFNGDSLAKADSHLRWFSYVAHEYLNVNVKRIRPLALGPFDYDQPNVTDMLCVSEACRSTTRIWC